MSPHTRAKHELLRKYLQAWFPILTQAASRFGLTSQRVLYVDGFAGPGEYSKGEPGSPVIAYREASNHPRPFPVPVEMLFIEERKDRFAHLENVINREVASARGNTNVSVFDPRCGDCDMILGEILKCSQARGEVFGPALAFLDQFGYGAVSMDLIRRILQFPRCEVFTYLDYKDMNRWIGDPSKAPAFERAFGGDEWQKCLLLPERERRARLLELYKEALKGKDRGNATYVQSFMMYDGNNMPLYWLIFCTNHLRGLEEMKRAMWSVDRTGNFRFSDREAEGQLHLLGDHYDDDWLIQQIRERFKGRRATAREIKEFVLVETPCYLFKSALKRLETVEQCLQIVSSPSGRKPGTFPDDMLEGIVVRIETPLF